MEFALHLRLHEIAGVLVEKIRCIRMRTRVRTMGGVGPFQGPVDSLCRIARGRCPRLRCQRPFRAQSGNTPGRMIVLLTPGGFERL